MGKPAETYLNRQDIREKLHIPSNAPAFEMCSSTLKYNQSFIGSIWVYEKLKGKLRMLKYSGNFDGAVPTLGTMRWIKALNWTVVENFRPYYVNDKQVAGYVEVRDGNFTFATVHGAGHLVP